MARQSFRNQGTGNQYNALTSGGRAVTSSDPLRASGVRNIHRDTDGSVIGGQMPDGQGGYQPFGSRVRPGTRPVSQIGKPVTAGLDRLSAMNAKPTAAPAAPQVAPATAPVAASASPAARPQSPAAPNLMQGARAFRSQAAPAPPVNPATLTPQIANNTPGPVPVVNGQRINRLTGKPMGWLPGDRPMPANPNPTAPKNTAELNAAVADYQKRGAVADAARKTVKFDPNRTPPPSPTFRDSSLATNAAGVSAAAVAQAPGATPAAPAIQAKTVTNTGYQTPVVTPAASPVPAVTPVAVTPTAPATAAATPTGIVESDKVKRAQFRTHMAGGPQPERNTALARR